MIPTAYRPRSDYTTADRHMQVVPTADNRPRDWRAVAFVAGLLALAVAGLALGMWWVA